MEAVVIGTILLCGIILKTIWHFGYYSAEADQRRAHPAPPLYDTSSIVEDRPQEQSAFVFMHEAFVDEPPKE